MPGYINQFNIYCDESCHLEKDESEIMVLGAIWCPKDKVAKINREIIELKSTSGFSPHFEIKWVKVSPSRLSFYVDLLNYFFDNEDLHFRALVAEKNNLNHEEFNQTHDDWYYKMYFGMLRTIFDPMASYRIFLDIKDTRSKWKTRKLHEVLCNEQFDFRREIIQDVQVIRSHESPILQLTDLLTGILSYANRNLSKSFAKLHLVSLMKEKSGYELTSSTLYKEDKVNIFMWKARGDW